MLTQTDEFKFDNIHVLYNLKMYINLKIIFSFKLVERIAFFVIFTIHTYY